MAFKIIPLLLFFFIAHFSYAPAQDTPRKCHAVEADAHLRARFPALGTSEDFERWLAPQIRAYQQQGRARALSTIPIVFHIIHDGEAAGTGHNISATYINAQIEQLNDDFRRALGTSGYNTHPAGTDAEIEFCAVLTDPSGTPLAEAGIHRIDRRALGWQAPPFGSCIDDDFDDTYIETVIKPQSQWDPNRYLNVWVMDLACDVLGYAQFPSTSGLGGLGSNNGPASTDGVVLRNTTLGSTGQPFPGGSPYNRGRTATHEIGHFLGLRHIWGDQPCGNDYCADTPQAEGPARGCPDKTTCDGIRDMVENYMDYSSDACMNIFTADQKARMQTVLLNSPRRAALLNSTACVAADGTLDCTATISAYPYSEGFESSFGQWSQSAADNFDWSRQSGSTPSTDTGPSGAAAGNWYAYVESSAPNYSNKVSILTGPCFNLSPAGSAAFTFKYHLYGAANMGRLELQARTAGSAWAVLWSAAGNQGSAWQAASVDLSAYLGQTVQLRFTATTGSTWQGDMAIDELGLTAGEANAGACTNSITAFPYAESWESSFGAWTQETTDDFNWQRLTGATPSGDTGPGAAINGIWYAYIESSSPNYANRTATLNGPCYDLTTATEATFTFQYHLYGAATMGSLSLQARPQGGNWTTIWTRSGNQGNLWRGASVGLNSYVGTSVELRFVGTTGNTWQGDMAIDDLLLAIETDNTDAACRDIVLSITFDNYPEETSWQITDAAGALVAAGGPYRNRPDGSTLNLTGCLPEGCYNLTFFDSYGDGMCCTYGRGSYALTGSDGQVLASGSSFGDSRTTAFCLPDNSRRPAETGRDPGPVRDHIAVFPNPVHDVLRVTYQSKADAEVQWRLVDLLGKNLQAGRWAIEAGSNRLSVPVAQLPAGTYVLIIEHNGQPHSRRFVVGQ